MHYILANHEATSPLLFRHSATSKDEMNCFWIRSRFPVVIHRTQYFKDNRYLAPRHRQPACQKSRLVTAPFPLQSPIPKETSSPFYHRDRNLNHSLCSPPVEHSLIHIITHQSTSHPPQQVLSQLAYRLRRTAADCGGLRRTAADCDGIGRYFT